jgi:hypothetical protein
MAFRWNAASLCLFLSTHILSLRDKGRLRVAEAESMGSFECCKMKIQSLPNSEDSYPTGASIGIRVVDEESNIFGREFGFLFTAGGWNDKIFSV